MIVGVGCDCVDFKRMVRIMGRFREKFSQKILTSSEQEDFKKQKNTIAFMAKRFAVKEACFKAMGTGLKGMSWHDVSLSHTSLGAPVLSFSGGALERQQHLMENVPPGWQLHSWVSMTDTPDHAMAVVILEARDFL